MLKQIEVTEQDIARIRERDHTIKHQTELGFLMQHYGIRDGKVHLFIGIPGGGKSTLRNTLLIDFLKNNPDKFVYLHLSEETEEDFLSDMGKAPLLFSRRDQIFIRSEIDDPPKSSQSVEGKVQEILEDAITHDCDLIVFDNITTSEVYGERLSDQEAFTLEFSRKIASIKKPAIVFAHTSAEVKQTNRKLIDQNEIRGSKKIINRAQFLYILQQFEFNKDKISTLRIIKHRGASVDLRFWIIKYEKRTRTYERAVESDFEEFKNLIKQSN